MGGRQLPLRTGVAFSVLGLMTVSDEHDVVVLPSSKPTILLAAMLLHPGELVSTDFLRRAVWGDEFPASARSTLQTYILRLRQIFAKFGISYDAIKTVPGGYCLPISEESLDLSAFRSLLRTAEVQQDMEEELRLLDRGLQLWRGAPISNIQSELLHRDEVPRLSEEWIRASERRFDLQLGMGQCRQALPQLRATAQAHPGHERFWEQLIEALYQVGRQTEALAECRVVKQYLSEEHGIDPGPGLRDLELSILRGEPIQPRAAIRTRMTGGRADLGASDLSREFCLPGDLPDFTGRDREVAELTACLTRDLRGPAVAIVSGPPGVGKTALAIHLAHVLHKDFPDRCRLVSGTDIADGAAARSTAGLVHADLDTVDARTLVIVDGVHDMGQVQPFLPTSKQGALIITSRLSLAGLAASKGATLHRLVALDATDSRALLGSILGNGGLASDPDVLGQLADLCGHFPIALRIAATRFLISPRHRLARMVEWLGHDPIRRLTLPGDQEGSVAALFENYAEMLDKPETKAFCALGSRGPGPRSLDECARTLGMSEIDTEKMLERLIDYSLLESETIGYYRMQDLLCSFVLSRADMRASR